MRLTKPMRLAKVVAIAVIGLLAAQASAVADDTEKLKQQIEVLELKLQLAEQTVEMLEKECEELRSENARLKGGAPMKGDDPTAKSGESDESDQFRVGAVWVGISKDTNNPKKTTRWAISVAEREGKIFSGGLAIVTSGGNKVEVPFSGTAPVTGDGPIVFETPTLGRAKLFCRGRLTNGQASLVFSGTNPLGERVFGAAAMKPE